MKKQKHIFGSHQLAWLLSFLMAALIVPTLLFGDNEVEFKGQIVSITSTSSTAATLTVALVTPTTSGPQTAVFVDAATRIVGAGDVALQLSDLSVGQFIEARGIFTATGIYARKVEVKAGNDSKNEFELRGTISQITPLGGGAVSLTIGGSNVVANSATRIQRRSDSALLSLSDLAVGQYVEAQGNVVSGQWVATRIEIGQKMEDQSQMEFQGTITAISGDTVSIEVAQNPPVDTSFTKDASTQIRGTLSVGVSVDVKASMGSNYAIVAHEIDVAGAVESEHDGSGNGSGNGGGSGDGSGNGGGSGNGDHSGGSSSSESDRQIQLNPTPAAPANAYGKAEAKYASQGGVVEQELNVEGDHLLTFATYSVSVTLDSGATLNLGSFITDSEGQGEFQLNCAAVCPGFPTGKDVRNMKGVQVSSGSSGTILQGSF